MALILVPVNVAALFFVALPWGWTVAALAIGGMLPNLPIMLGERGLSKRMALPHVVIWTPLVGLLIWLLAGGRVAGWQATYLGLLLIVDAISLGFDFPDAVKWGRGDRDIA